MAAEFVRVCPMERRGVRFVEVTSRTEGAAEFRSRHYSTAGVPTDVCIENAVRHHWAEFGRIQADRYRDRCSR